MYILHTGFGFCVGAPLRKLGLTCAINAHGRTTRDAKAATVRVGSVIVVISVQDAKGQPYPMSQFKGKVALIMNTASECSYTDNGYKAATELYDKYKYKGLVVLGFPCNQFGGQEPGSAESVAEFACTRYKATFPIMGKVDVNGPNADPLWVHMKAHRPGILGTKSIKWNFTVFLVDKTGKTVARHSPGTKASALESEIVELLACNVRNDTWHSASVSTQPA